MSDMRIEALPQARVDQLAQDGATRVQQRRTEYCGTLWLGDKPNVTGNIFAISGRPELVQAGVFIPDSLPYHLAKVGVTIVAATIAIQSQGGDEARITDYRAVLVPDPRGQPVAWLQLQISGRATAGTALSYRIVVAGPDSAVAG